MRAGMNGSTTQDHPLIRGKRGCSEPFCGNAQAKRTPLESLMCKGQTARNGQDVCAGCSARFCLISLTLSIRSSACFCSEARSSALSTMSALRR